MEYIADPNLRSGKKFPMLTVQHDWDPKQAVRMLNFWQDCQVPDTQQWKWYKEIEKAFLYHGKEVEIQN